MARSIFVATLGLISVGLVTSASIKKPASPGQALTPPWTRIKGANFCFNAFFKPGVPNSVDCLPLEKPSNCMLQTWYELSGALGVVKRHFIPPPAYLGIKDHNDCLEEHRSENYVEHCLPSVKPSACSQDSWEKIQESFDGIGCGKVGNLDDIRSNFRLQHLEVTGWQMCLLSYKSGGHSERCMPGYQPDLCTDAAWEQLQRVFVGVKCPKRTRLITRVGPSPYLSVQGHEECLETIRANPQQSSSPTVKCLPESKPERCDSGAWFTLNSVFDGIRCPTITELKRRQDPAYLSISGHQSCLGFHPAVDMQGAHYEIPCMPNTKPDNCMQKTWEEIKEKFIGAGCRKKGFLVGGPSSQPPRYLDVENFDKCLDSYKASLSHQERCLPTSRPSGCQAQFWLELLNVFVGVECPAAQPMSANAPAYLSVPGHRSCLGQEYHSSGKFKTLCLLENRDGCASETLEKLKEVFEGPLCKDQNKKPVIVGADTLPPAHLSVPNHQDCLGTKHHPNGFKVKCLPKSKPESCPETSFDQLHDVFDGDMCEVESNPWLVDTQIGSVTPPSYQVDGYDKCLGVQASLTVEGSDEYCKLSVQPAGCADDVWATINQKFNGNLCREVPLSRKCVGMETPDSGNFSQVCAYFKKPTGCPDGVWAELSKGSPIGDYCREQPAHPRQRLVGGPGVGPPAYLNIPDFKKCLGSKHQGAHKEYCMPSVIKPDCPKESWEALKNSFKGRSCNDFVMALPPAHLSIPNHQLCLGTHLAVGGTHYESCLPAKKPEECETSTGNAVIAVFNGEICRGTLNEIPVKFHGIDGILDCLEDIIGPANNNKKCLPLSKKQGCDQETYDELMAILFDSTPNSRNIQLRGGPPAYLSVEGHEKCLSSQPVGNHIEKCMPSERPAACEARSWEILSQVFSGDHCGNQARALPPAYLFVEGHQHCLGEHKVGTNVEKCLPSEKPDNCSSNIWEEIQAKFQEGSCRDASSPFYPVYLTVPDYSICLQTQPSGSHIELCLPAKKPNACPQPSWTKLQQVFTGTSCGHQSISLYPRYLSVDGHQDCLSSQTQGTHSENCIPSQKPDQCTEDAWNQLQTKFDGAKCGVELVSFYPQYLTVPGYNKCLKTQVAGTHIEKCLPDSKPVSCEQYSWTQLQEVFTGSFCRHQSVSLFPEYLQVPGFKDCFGSQIVGNHSQSCLPSSKPSACSQASWTRMIKVFNGAQCGDGSASTAVSLYPEYLSVDGYDKCLGIQASGSHIEKCLPQEKPTNCLPASWQKLQTAFTGSRCYRKPVEFYPRYLELPIYHDCLETQASGSHSVKCLPYWKPRVCQQDAWNELKENFQGAKCGNRAVPFYPSFQNVPGFEKCLDTQVSGTHIEKCLPLSKPSHCEQSSFDELKRVFTGKRCSVQHVSFSPEYLEVPHHEDCLKTQKIGTHIEKCIPLQKPTLCQPPAWHELQRVFKGTTCSEKRGKRQLIGGVRPPAYLRVPGHRNCLGDQAVGTHIEHCLPYTKPTGCSEDSWLQLQYVFHGNACYTGSGQPQVNFPVDIDGLGSSGGRNTLPLRSCTSDGDCNTNDRCHSVGYPGSFCVPASKRCYGPNDCPSVGNLMEGKIGANCDIQGLCQYDTALAIAK